MLFFYNLNLGYDVQSVIKDIEEKKYPDYQAMLEIFYGDTYFDEI